MGRYNEESLETAVARLLENGRVTPPGWQISTRPLLTGFSTNSIMSGMSDQNEIDPNAIYSTGELTEILGLTDRHIGRLVDEGYFPGARRSSPKPGSKRQIPGTAVIHFLEERTKTTL